MLVIQYQKSLRIAEDLSNVSKPLKRLTDTELRRSDDPNGKERIHKGRAGN